MIKTLAAIMIVSFPASASAFEEFGLRSGMSLEQVQVRAKDLGKLISFYNMSQNGAGTAALSRTDNVPAVDKFVFLGFCHGYLTSVFASLNSDTDLYEYTTKIVAEYGENSRVQTHYVEVPVPGTKNLHEQTITMEWKIQGEVAKITLGPKSYNTDGSLQFRQRFSVFFSTDNSCDGVK